MGDTTPPQVSVKTARQLMQPPTPQKQGETLADRADIACRWYSPLQRRWCEFSGEIRVLGVADLHAAAAYWNNMVGAVAFETVPTELRRRLWPLAKLMAMFQGQRGAEAFLDQLDRDRALLSQVMEEVEKLEAECFPVSVESGEGGTALPRVVVTTRRRAAVPGAADSP